MNRVAQKIVGHSFVSPTITVHYGLMFDGLHIESLVAGIERAWREPSNFYTKNFNLSYLNLYFL